MTQETLDPVHFVLKVKGKHNLIFKTKHNDPQYLKKVGEELVMQEDGHFTEYEIHRSDHANKEMTQAEHLLHPTFE